ncbi:MAG: nuclear transport factor 2 family protein [Pseudomonadota bacterium]
MSSKLEVSKEWFRRVWADEDEDAIREMFVPDGLARGLGQKPLEGPEGFIGFHRLFLSQFKDVSVEVDRYMEDGDWISLMIIIRAKDRHKDVAVETTGQAYVRIVDGKLAEAYNHLDFLSLYEQVDLLPAATLEKCLQGVRVG